MKKSYAAATLAVSLVCASFASAMPNDPDNKPGGERYCNQYAQFTASAVEDGLKRNPSCLDYSRGVHSNVKMHYDWCMRTPRGTVDSAGMHIRDLVQKCTASNRGGGGRGNFGGNGGGNPGGGPLADPAFCQSYAQGMVVMGSEAIRRNCLQYGPQGLHTNYQSHYNWCLGKPRGAVTGAASRVNGLLASCNR